MGMLSDIKDFAYRDQASKILKMFPDAAPDLVNHYVISKNLSKTLGKVPAAAVGLGKEAVDFMGLSDAGFSFDDLGADYAGLIGTLSPQEAYDRGFFTHTEKKRTGVGQGLFSKVLDKVLK